MWAGYVVSKNISGFVARQCPDSSRAFITNSHASKAPSVLEINQEKLAFVIRVTNRYNEPPRKGLPECVWRGARLGNAQTTNPTIWLRSHLCRSIPNFFTKVAEVSRVLCSVRYNIPKWHHLSLESWLSSFHIRKIYTLSSEIEQQFYQDDRIGADTCKVQSEHHCGWDDNDEDLFDWWLTY